MADFSNLAALAITGDTTKVYTFGLIPGKPSIVLAAADDANPAFLDERIRMSIERASQPARKATDPTVDSTKAELEEVRATDLRLIAYTCAKAWGTPPKDANGDTPEFTPDNCHDFLKALPPYMADPFRGFAGNVYNFVPTIVTAEDAAKLGN